jgi:DNA mismatch repair protein MutH
VTTLAEHELGSQATIITDQTVKRAKQILRFMMEFELGADDGTNRQGKSDQIELEDE